MSFSMRLARYTLEWAGLVPVAVLNALLRDVTYAHTLGSWTAQQVSCYPAFMMFYLYAQYIHGRRPVPSASEAWWVGVWWALLSVTLKTAASLGWEGKRVADVVREYDVREGECWPLLLVGVLCLPRLVLASQPVRCVMRTMAKDYSDAAGHPVHEETHFERDIDDAGGATTVRARVRTTDLGDGTTATEAVESVTYTRAG